MNLPKAVALLIIVILCSYALLLYSRPTFTPPKTQKAAVQTSPTPVSQARMYFSLSPLHITTVPQEISIMIDSGNNVISEAQVEIQYDPSRIQVSTLYPDAYFKNPIILLNEHNPNRGRIFYALTTGINGEEVRGTGRFITFTLTRNPLASESGRTEISFLPKTSVHGSGHKSPIHLTTENLSITYDTISPSPIPTQ